MRGGERIAFSWVKDVRGENEIRGTSGRKYNVPAENPEPKTPRRIIEAGVNRALRWCMMMDVDEGRD